MSKSNNNYYRFFMTCFLLLFAIMNVCCVHADVMSKQQWLI